MGKRMPKQNRQICLQVRGWKKDDEGLVLVRLVVRVRYRALCWPGPAWPGRAGHAVRLSVFRAVQLLLLLLLQLLSCVAYQHVERCAYFNAATDTPDERPPRPATPRHRAPTALCGVECTLLEKNLNNILYHEKCGNFVPAVHGIHGFLCALQKLVWSACTSFPYAQVPLAKYGLCFILSRTPQWLWLFSQ